MITPGQEMTRELVLGYLQRVREHYNVTPDQPVHSDDLALMLIGYDLVEPLTEQQAAILYYYVITALETC